MFSIFQKKENLIDHLHGITDIHNHILPGIDDGAANEDEAIQLLRKFKNLGITNFIATPHIMNDYYPNTPQTINTALELLRQKQRDTAGLEDISIRAAAEYMMDQPFLELIEKGDLLVLKDKMVLVEMSYFQAPINLNEILFKLQTQGYRPVLAHPERYAYYHSKDLKKYEDLKNRGCQFQMNVLSLTSHYGTSMERIAVKLLEAGMIDYLGSDTHREQHLEKLSQIRIPSNLMQEVKKVIQKTRETF